MKSKKELVNARKSIENYTFDEYYIYRILVSPEYLLILKNEYEEVDYFPKTKKEFKKALKKLFNLYMYSLLDTQYVGRVIRVTTESELQKIEKEIEQNGRARIDYPISTTNSSFSAVEYAQTSERRIIINYSVYDKIPNINIVKEFGEDYIFSNEKEITITHPIEITDLERIDTWDNGYMIYSAKMNKASIGRRDISYNNLVKNFRKIITSCEDNAKRINEFLSNKSFKSILYEYNTLEWLNLVQSFVFDMYAFIEERVKSGKKLEDLEFDPREE